MAMKDGLPATGFVRLRQVIGPGNPVPVGKTKWHEGVKSGQYPKPVKHGALSLYRVEDIRALLSKLGGE